MMAGIRKKLYIWIAAFFGIFIVASNIYGWALYSSLKRAKDSKSQQTKVKYLTKAIFLYPYDERKQYIKAIADYKKVLEFNNKFDYYHKFATMRLKQLESPKQP